MIWQPGKSLYGNRYIIQRKLGEGGFGITYLAKNKKGEFVVIKTLKDEVLTNPELSQFRDKYYSKRDAYRYWQNPYSDSAFPKNAPCDPP